MKTFPAALRVLTPVATLQGPDDALAAINTTELPDGCLVVVTAIPSLYQFRKTSTATESSPNIIAPDQGGSGRWFRYNSGPSTPAALSVAVPAIGPNTTAEVTATIPDKNSSADMVDVNITDSGLSASLGIVGVRPNTGATTAAIRFANFTGATVAGATIALRTSVIPG